MKGIYWRPKYVSRYVLVLVALMALGSVVAVETFKQRKEQRNFSAKLRAARHMSSAMVEVKKFRLQHKLTGQDGRDGAERFPIDKENDPTGSGLIGFPLSPITSNTGYLLSKQATINPNFAAVAAHLLKRAGVEKGDVVAVGFSGSFPALNLAVLSACEVLGLEPIIITSAAASEWGANIPGLSWLETENHLYKLRIVRHKTIAASIGGVEDKGYGMPPDGIKELKRVIEQLGIVFLDAETEDTLERRMEIYDHAAAGRPYKAYINVGGGTISVGSEHGKKMFLPGLNRRLPPEAADIDSIMVRFAQQDVPVIHFTQVRDLARMYELPIPPTEAQQVGKGTIFYKVEYNLTLAAILLGVLLVAVYLLVRQNLMARFTGNPKKDAAGPPEPMV